YRRCATLRTCPSNPALTCWAIEIASLRDSRAPLGMTILNFLRRIGGNLELDEPTLEAASLDGAIGNAGGHPDAANDFGARAEIGEDESASEKSEDRRQEVGHAFFVFAHVIADEGGGVHSHESDERAKVEHFRA